MLQHYHGFELKARSGHRSAARGRTVERLYETVYCARGQAENFIKLHKTQLASDRTSCRSPRTNQFRLILHTAAYWLLHTMRAGAPKRSSWKTAEFATLRLRLMLDALPPRDHEPRGVVAPPRPSRNFQPRHNQN